jgi:hypothetical protein
LESGLLQCRGALALIQMELKDDENLDGSDDSDEEEKRK